MPHGAAPLDYADQRRLHEQPDWDFRGAIFNEGSRIYDATAVILTGNLKAHLGNVLTYLRHRIAKAAAEGLNAKNPVDQIHGARFRKSPFSFPLPNRP